MSPQRAPSGNEFVDGFLDDYFAECDEHLTLVRRALLALEGAIGDSATEAARLEELFRSFHSVKGISAMVDLREAERLAHELESCLRALRNGDLAVTTDAVTMLIDGTATLERVIESRRSGSAAPSIDAVVQTLRSAAAGPPGRTGKAAAPEDRAGGAADGPQWRVIFVPSPALVERGVKVDTIRARLGSVGRITSVSPRVTPGGGIAFEFLLSGPADPAAFEPWRADGLVWGRIDPASGPEEADPLAGHAPHSPARSVADHGILAPSHFVRVDLERLDDVMRRVADLVITRSRLDDSLRRLERAIPAREWRILQEGATTFERQLRDLREDVMRVRLVPVDEIFRRMPFVVRDVAREAGKDVRVALRGQNTEIDKFLVERMMDPVLHLVRNAVSHGLETPERRLAAGKAAQGLITLAASTVGERVLLQIEDDGAGIDTGSVAERARAAGMRIPDGVMDPGTLMNLICEPGLSTRREADRASGRGMGMAVVRTALQELGGTLSVETEPGQGTRFLVTLPLTLAITEALIAVASGHTFAVPQRSVEEVIEIDAASVRQLERNELVPYRGGSLPLLRLSTLLGLRGERPARLHAFVIGTGQEGVALGVDRIVGQREIVVRSMSDALLKIEGISGATELGDGRAVLILDVAALSRSGRAAARHRFAGAPRSSDGATA